MNFNTSHVNVNQYCIIHTKENKTNFNTSHVNVNPAPVGAFCLGATDFNTSHVNVNQELCKQDNRGGVISIHLMLMLIM